MHEDQDHRSDAKQWVLVVVLLYVAILTALTVPVGWAAFAPNVNLWEANKVFLDWEYWLWLLVMGAGQAAMLLVPVTLATGRPVTRASVWPPILTAGLMMGVMVWAAGLAFYETFYMESNVPHAGYWLGWTSIGLGVLTWVIWSVIFFRLSRKSEPTDLITRQCRLLLKGSILELLVAVPTHIVARYRDYCCAGMLTFIGLTMGISVMLFSFGPAVFFLYVARWKRLRAKADGAPLGGTTK